MEDETERTVLTRRDFVKSALMLGATSLAHPLPSLLESAFAAPTSRMRTRAIPSSGKQIPVVGLGTWQQFDVSSDPAYLNPLKKVLRTLFKFGGSVIDTSPMYGRAEQVLGKLLTSLGKRKEAFITTKVWTSGRENGIQQMKNSMNKLNVRTLDLIQVHNLVDWKTHLDTLNRWKKSGKIRYTGVTHYTQSAFNELETVLKSRDIDFIQLPYSISFRAAENRLLPLAQDQDTAVIINRPFEAGSLFRKVRGESLPEWSSSIGCKTWAQYFLKYILGHSAVTCVIPGTSNPQHMLDNVRAGTGAMPSDQKRKRMLEYWKSI
jgi:diketogulonate reductase-like aldo/keto reductase